MESIVCFMCTGNAVTQSMAFYEVQSAVVPSSQKPLRVVLQHLANCIKYKLIFQSDAYVCVDCFRELSNYDSLMLNLLTSQRRLTRQLQSALVEKNESTTQVKNEQPIEIEVEFEDDPNLQDAFNPNLDTKEELIEVDEDDVIEEEVVDDLEGYVNDSSQHDLDLSDAASAEGGRNGQECVVCGALFTSKFLLYRHMKEVHNEKQYNCRICGVARRDEEYLELHMNIHEGKTENECRYCPKRFSRPVNTLRHMRIHWDKKKFQCEKCGERFSQDNLLYNHRMRHEAEENPVICSICNQSFKSRKTYNHHVLIHQENRPRHQCDFCPKSFTERYTLKVHLKTHMHCQSPTGTVESKETIPNVEKEETEEAITVLVEGDGDGGETTCVICSKKYDTKMEVEKHLQEAHDVHLK